MVSAAGEGDGEVAGEEVGVGEGRAEDEAVGGGVRVIVEGASLTLTIRL